MFLTSPFLPVVLTHSCKLQTLRERKHFYIIASETNI